MKKDTKRIVGGRRKVVRVQSIHALRRGISSMGTVYQQNDPIIHISSSRRTGEIFTLTRRDMTKIQLWPIGQWRGELRKGK